MNLTKSEAEAALIAIVRSQEALRHAFRAHHGHLHLWLWGAIWIAMAMTAHWGGTAAIENTFPYIALAGGLVSGLIGWWQRQAVRVPVDRRFLGVVLALVLFAGIWPLVLRPNVSHETIFTFISLLVAQIYVVAGIWFDSYLLWLGLILAALMIIGLCFFLPIFWIWVAVCGGGALLLGGTYVRFFWR